jgi:hypothetical protein
MLNHLYSPQKNMKNKQLNFFITFEQAQKWLVSLHDLGYVLLPEKSQTPPINPPEDMEIKNGGLYYLSLMPFLPEIKNQYVEKTAAYFPMVGSSPIIEIILPFQKEHQINRGRIFYSTTQDFVVDEQSFQKKADDLLKFFKKTFNNTANQAQKPFWVSENAQGFTLKM